MRETGALSTGELQSVYRGVPAPPGVVMVSPPTTLCNTERGQS